MEQKNKRGTSGYFSIDFELQNKKIGLQWFFNGRSIFLKGRLSLDKKNLAFCRLL